MRLFNPIAIVLTVACGTSSPKSEPTSQSIKPKTTVEQAVSLDGMIDVPGGTVLLGPRMVEAVSGWQNTNGVMGMTPNEGKGQDQRAAGAPPPPGQPPSGGVGHLRPGSGMPSAPPNMPGNHAKPLNGKSELWTANPGNQMRPKKVRVLPFSMDKFEVTRSAYKIFIDTTGYRPPFVEENWADDGWNWKDSQIPTGTEDHPVVLVSWYDAEAYCLWQGKRLPTEAEWQLAALGDLSLNYDYPWGKTYQEDALNHGQMAAPNFDDSDGYLTTSPVGAFPKGDSPYGLSDMFGNVWEFTSDFRRSSWDFYTSTAIGPEAKGPGLYVAVRGGAYFFDLRPNPGGERNEFLSEIRRKTSGFRCAK